MMCGYRSIIGLAFSCIVSLSAPALAHPDGPDELLRLADAYYADGNYDASITEYLRFICFAPADSRLSHAYYRAGLAYDAMGNGDFAIPYLERAAALAPEAAVEGQIRLRLATELLSRQQFDLAKIELFQLMNGAGASRQKSRSALLLGLVHCTEGSWEQARACFSFVRDQESGCEACREPLLEIDSLLAELRDHPGAKSPALSKWLSTFLPGLGQLYAGNVGGGLNALALNAVTSYALLDLAAGRHVRDSLLVFSLLWVRYYQGNRTRAEGAARTANERYAERNVRRLCALAQRTSRAMSGDSLTVSY
jgi:tetratricopeptide (TPR) repeat protein